MQNYNHNNFVFPLHPLPLLACSTWGGEGTEIAKKNRLNFTKWKDLKNLFKNKVIISEHNFVETRAPDLSGGAWVAYGENLPLNLGGHVYGALPRVMLQTKTPSIWQGIVVDSSAICCLIFVPPPIPLLRLQWLGMESLGAGSSLTTLNMGCSCCMDLRSLRQYVFGLTRLSIRKASVC